jgi:hypothetical protein
MYRCFALAALTVAWMFAAWPAAAAYDYPFKDPFKATVVGLPIPALRAELPKVKFRTGYLPKTVEREIPKALWYNAKIPFLYALQRKPAPLVFVIAGTGGGYDTAKNQLIMRALYGAGMHVVGIASPSHASFITAACTTGVPGYLEYDARDLYTVMQDIRTKLRVDKRITEFYLTGYSLGASHAAFVANLDHSQKVFDFSRVLLINPPLSLYSSVARLDLMIQSIPGGIDNFPQFFNRMVTQVSAAYKASNKVAFDEALFFKVFEDNPPSNSELAGLIGASFRISASSLIATSDIVTKYGFAIPANATVTRTSSLTDYAQVTTRTGFTDYYHEMYYPYYKAREPSLTRESLAERQTLNWIREFLEDAEYVGVVHNQDDVILAPGEIDFFREVFKERAIIYPYGGHMGNLSYKENVRNIVDFFTVGWQ